MVALLASIFLLSARSTTAQGHLTLNPPSATFGNVAVGTSKAVSITLGNSGTTDVIISAVTNPLAHVEVKGLTLPAVLVPKRTLTMSVLYSPAAAGATSGIITISSNASDSKASLLVTGSGIPPALSATPASASMTATVGSSSSQTIQLKNSGSANITISGVTVPVGGFTVTGLTTPLTLAAGKTTNLNLVFSPKAAGSVSGDLLIASSSPTLSISASGKGVASTKSLSVGPASLSFGNVAIGTSASENLTLTNTGNAGVTISSVSASGAGVTVAGSWSGTLLNAGQTTTLTVNFTPTKSGSVTGSLTVTSNASNSPAVVSVSGTGEATASYSVALSWSPSTSSGVDGYNVYRGTVSGGPYSKVVSSPVSGDSYTDTTVQAGTEYYYVVTSVTSGGKESSYSSPISAKVP